MKKTVQQTLADIQTSIGKIEKTVAVLPTRSQYTSLQKTVSGIQKTVAELPTKELLDQKLTLLRQDFDKTLDKKLTALRDDMNKDIAKSVMPLVYHHDERLDRIDKNLDLSPIPVRLPQ